MIIQCEHCSAKFRIDDAKLANGAVKVRCAKCKEIFVVTGEEVSAESVQPPQDQSAAPEFQGDSSAAGSDFSFDQEPLPDMTAKEAQSPAADEFDWKDTAVNLNTPDTTAEFDVSSFGTSGSSATTIAEKANAVADNDFDFGDISIQSSPSPAEGTSLQEDFAIDFGEVSFETPSLPSSGDGGAFSESSTAEFSFDAPPVQEASPVAAAADFLPPIKTEEPKPSAFAAGGENVNFGDFSFGDMADESPADKTVVPKQMSSPGKNFAASRFPEASDEELVPTSLASRKKSGSRFPFILIFGAIVIIVALAVAGVYFIGGSKAFSKAGLGFLVDWYGQKNAEEGGMVIRNSSSSYVINTSAGELFVVRGEVVNNFRKPRASVQVKVSILGPGGEAILSKSAFCGNSLSGEQLTSLPLAKIEEVMNNQFGDSLANLGVKPGSAIPFVVVMSNVPKEATDFSVQVIGSTIATQ